jgi:hypothetical protein
MTPVVGSQTGNEVFYILSWSVVLMLVALWSLAAWAFHAIANWTVTSSGALTGGTAAFEGLQLPNWLAPWIPPELGLAFTSLLASAGPFVESALNQAPALASGISVAIWVVWGIGTALLILLGVVCSGVIAMLRRRGGSGLSSASAIAPGAQGLGGQLSTLLSSLRSHTR